MRILAHYLLTAMKEMNFLVITEQNLSVNIDVGIKGIQSGDHEGQ